MIWPVCVREGEASQKVQPRTRGDEDEAKKLPRPDTSRHMSVPELTSRIIAHGHDTFEYDH